MTRHAPDQGSPAPLPRRRLGRTSVLVPPIGFGAFKIGRSHGAKYPTSYAIPDEATAAAMLNGVLDLGAALIDTAPAYGSSEERIGHHLAARRHEFTLVTKVGETLEETSPGCFESRHDFTPDAVRRSAEASVERLGGPVDVLLVHADSRDAALARDLALIAAMERLRADGLAGAIGFSGKSAEGDRAALPWADAVMVEYHIEDRSGEALMEEASRRGVGVLVKKALASGHLPASDAIAFVLANRCVDCVIVGGLDLGRFAANVAVARAVRGAGT
ncbi:MAG: aldo/keto reductase [Phycisphaerales bacterium]